MVQPAGDKVPAAAGLTNPLDNDAKGLDVDARSTYDATTQQLTDFSIKLTDAGETRDLMTAAEYQAYAGAEK